MGKKKKIKISMDIDPTEILKETREERKERIKFSNAMTTRVADKDKKKYNRQKFKKFDENA